MQCPNKIIMTNIKNKIKSQQYPYVILKFKSLVTNKTKNL